MDKVNFLVGSKDLDIKGFKVFDEVALSFLEILSKESQKKLQLSTNVVLNIL